MKYSSGGCREESPFVPAVEWVITCVNCRAQSAIAAAAGGLITTPTDYAKFLIELIQPSPADEFHVSKKSHGEMIRPQFPFQDFDGYSVSWGLLGCRMVRMSQHQLITPGGSNPGFHGQPRPSDSPPLCYHLRIMDKHAFKTDKEGHIVTKTVTGFSSAVISNIAVLLAVSYVDSAEALEKGQSKSIQFAMTPEQCFDVAEVLIKQAKTVMDPSSDGSIQ